MIDRLEVEHEVIAELLEHVDGALVALVSQGGVVDRCRTSSSDTHTLLSHLSYEERELFHSLAQRGFQ